MYLCVLASVVETQEYCLPIKVPSEQISISGCFSRTISMNKCIGICSSNDYVENEYEGKKASCSCCIPTRYILRDIEVVCGTKNGGREIRLVTIREPIECGCRICNK